MSKKRPTARPSARPNTGPSTGPGLPAEGLARMIDEALALLEPRYPAPADTRRALAPPLPSLLDRCEALLAASGGAAPIRLVLGFDDPARHAGMALLDMLPNLHLLPALASPPLASLSPPFALSDPEPALGPAEWNRAAAAAIGTLDASCRARGRSLVLCLDSRAGYDRLPADPGHSLLSSLRDRQPVAAVILARHPLQSWMEMRHCGEAGYHPARLEDYAGRQLAFLHDHADLPVITEADVQADPADALHRLAGSLALPLSPELWSGLQDEVSTLDTGDFWPGLPAGGPVLLDAAGAPATEEPLDSPAYVELCTLLGYAPDQLDLPPRTRTTPAGYGTSGGRTRGTLPEPQPGRPMARLSALLPRIDRLAEATPLPAPARRLDAAQVVAMVEDCLGHPDGFYERLDALLAGLSPADGALLLISCAAHYAAAGEAIHGLGLLAEAVEIIPPADRGLHLLAAGLYLRLRKPELAVAVLTADVHTGPLRLPAAEQGILEAGLAGLFPAKAAEHGHALLLDDLAARPPVPLSRRRVLIEIGTTRERVPGQGSTEKLARVCAELGLDFITVDMDARNSAMARRMFRRLNLPFRAVTAKGEDFLAAWEGPIDYCFLDAYDFDHGNHSDLRQSRYETFLGSRISDAQCHQMHLDCARSLVEKLAPDGALCFDDTWTDEAGDWTAKGKTAMPFLLEHGFRVMAARNRAALLVRGG